MPLLEQVVEAMLSQQRGAAERLMAIASEGAAEDVLAFLRSF